MFFELQLAVEFCSLIVIDRRQEKGREGSQVSRPLTDCELTCGAVLQAGRN